MEARSVQSFGAGRPAAVPKIGEIQANRAGGGQRPGMMLAGWLWRVLPALVLGIARSAPR